MLSWVKKIAQYSVHFAKAIHLYTILLLLVKIAQYSVHSWKLYAILLKQCIYKIFLESLCYDDEVNQLLNHVSGRDTCKVKQAFE